MATFTDSGYPTLVDMTKRMRPDGSVETDMAELLQKKLPFIQDIPWMESNSPTGHLVTSRTGIPTPTWRGFNEGVDPTKTETEQYVESIGMLRDYSNVDPDFAKLHGDIAAFRMSEDKGKIEAFGQEIERAFIYESVLTAPKKIHGLTPRYPATSGFTASDYVMKIGTVSGSNAESIWLINWDPDSLFGIFPKHSVGGLQKRDLGEKLVTSPVHGTQMTALVTEISWDAGLCVKDYRKAVRLQWDPDDTSGVADTGKSLYLGLQNMLDTVYDLGPNARFYMSRVSSAKLNAQLASNAQSSLEWRDLNGRLTPHFRGIPVRISDTLIGETAIS